MKRIGIYNKRQQSGSKEGNTADMFDPSKIRETILKEVSHDTGASQLILSISKATSSTAVKTADPVAIRVKNESSIPMVVLLGYQSYTGTTAVAGHTSSVDDTAVAGVVYLHVMLEPGAHFIPPLRGAISVSQGTANTYPHADNFANQSDHGMEGTVVDFTAPGSDGFLTTVLDTDNTTATNNIVGSATNTLVYIEQYTSASNCGANYFRIGDRLRINNEIFRSIKKLTGSSLDDN